MVPFILNLDTKGGAGSFMHRFHHPRGRVTALRLNGGWNGTRDGWVFSVRQKFRDPVKKGITIFRTRNLAELLVGSY